MNITILIANHNYCRFLIKSLNSAFNQTLKPKTICFIDDCSDDESWRVFSSIESEWTETIEESNLGHVRIKECFIEGTRLIGIRLPACLGPSQARNVGIDFTKEFTDIYSILDADDEMLPNKLEECIKPFENPRIGLVYANYYNINEENGVKNLQVKEPYDVIRINQECIIHSGFLVRKELLLAVKDEFGYYDNYMRTCEDWDLEIRLSKICLFYHVPLTLTNALVHSNNSSNSVNKEIWHLNWDRIRQKHFQKR